MRRWRLTTFCDGAAWAASSPSDFRPTSSGSSAVTLTVSLRSPGRAAGRRAKAGSPSRENTDSSSCARPSNQSARFVPNALRCEGTTRPRWCSAAPDVAIATGGDGCAGNDCRTSRRPADEASGPGHTGTAAGAAAGTRPNAIPIPLTHAGSAPDPGPRQAHRCGLAARVAVESPYAITVRDEYLPFDQCDRDVHFRQHQARRGPSSRRADPIARTRRTPGMSRWDGSPGGAVALATRRDPGRAWRSGRRPPPRSSRLPPAARRAGTAALDSAASTRLP